MAIEQNVIKIISSISQETGITPQSRLSYDLGLDSLNMMELCVALGGAFNVSINNKIGSVKTVGDIFQCPENEYKAYWKRFLLFYTIFEPARQGAKAFTKKLRADGHTIYIVTKRVFTRRDDFLGKLMRFVTRNWLWRNGIRYDDIVFCDNDIPESKKHACMEKQIDIMIDDEPININAIAPIAKVICFDASYNRGCAGENILRVEDFEEAYRYFVK